MIRRVDRREERGAALIVLTLVLVLLMGFAAFGVDYANALSQRRQNQGSVDTGSLSGIQETAGKLAAAARADAESEVIRISYESLSPDMTPAEWDTAWTTCTDPDKPGSFSIDAPNTTCISFTSTMQRMRVKLPAINVETGFGQVLGRDFIETSAHAVVGVQSGGGGAVLPFGVPGGVEGDTHLCLKTGPNPSSFPPCDGPTTGNFHFLDISFFGNDDITPITTTQCQGQTNSRLGYNIAAGIDHELSKAPDATAVWQDRALCNDGNFDSRPWTLTTETGNGKGDALHDGLVAGTGGVPGRLDRGGNTITLAGENIDDSPLWMELNADGIAFCQPIVGTVDDHLEMIQCLDEHRTNGGPIMFDLDIRDQVRFAWVPVFWDLILGAGSSDHNIWEFRPVWLQTTYWKCNASDCAIIHSPGEAVGGSGGGGNRTIEALTALQFPLSALDPIITKEGPGGTGSVSYELIE